MTDAADNVLDEAIEKALKLTSNPSGGVPGCPDHAGLVTGVHVLLLCRKADLKYAETNANPPKGTWWKIGKSGIEFHGATFAACAVLFLVIALGLGTWVYVHGNAVESRSEEKAATVASKEIKKATGVAQEALEAQAELIRNTMMEFRAQWKNEHEKP